MTTAKRPMAALFTGSREWDDVIAIHSALMQLAERNVPVTIIVGDCPTGADAIAWQLVTDGAVPRVTASRHLASWDRRGKRAGPERNQRMVDTLSALRATHDCYVWAFLKGDSRGTRDCIRRAKAAGFRVFAKDAK